VSSSQLARRKLLRLRRVGMTLFATIVRRVESIFVFYAEFRK